MKKRIYVDMDGVLCDYYGAYKKSISEFPEQKYPQATWGYFLRLCELPDAVESFRKLQKKYDVWILTRPSFRNVNCFTEKAQWVWDHLGFDVLQKTIMAGDKSLLKGDYLIDDQNGAGQDRFEGEWIHFGSEKFPNWKSVIDYLI